jgi:thiol-disulfide isomerase/thioredoxin
MTGHPAVAAQCLDLVEAHFKDVEDKGLADSIAKSLGNSRKRLALVGQPFTVEGVDLEGKPFDWKAYAGKVVLVDFWATWCGPCLAEIPNIEKNFEEFQPRGFEVVGVNLDTNVEDVKRFFSVQELKWPTVTSQVVVEGKADPEDFGALPMAAKCGVDAIPFLVLVGKDGKVDSLHVRGPKLRSRLVALLGEETPAEKPAGDKPAADKPAADKPAEEKPSGDKPTAEEKPAEDKPAADKPAAEKPAADKPAASPGVSVVAAVIAALFAAEEPAAAPPPVADDPAINPYRAKPGLSPADLVQYVLRMLDKPKTIQTRPGFTEAVADACDRVLSAEPAAKEVDFFIAAESKFQILHKDACAGSDDADKQLVAFVEKMKDDQRPRIARQVAFFQQERKVLNAVEAPAEQIPALLAELKEFYAKEKLEAKHLRMASSTVALINKLEDGVQRESHFTEFGGTFAKSSDKELARYGKKLAKKPETSGSDLVGKPLELAGTTAKGANFAWDAFRGKVVLVDFWATWCGPCRREMPNVKALYEKHGDKGFEVVGVSLDQDQEALAAYLEENEIPWDTLAGDGTQELAGKYGVRAIPTMMLVDKEGKIAGVAHNVGALTAQLEKLLGVKKP